MDRSVSMTKHVLGAAVPSDRYTAGDSRGLGRLADGYVR
jgi:hypothetical protein